MVAQSQNLQSPPKSGHCGHLSPVTSHQSLQNTNGLKLEPIIFFDTALVFFSKQM